MAKLFTSDMVDYLRTIAPGRFSGELTKMMNDRFGTHFTQKQIVDLKNNRGIRSNVSGIPQEEYDKRRITTPVQDEFIKKNQKGLYAKELAELVNEKFGSNLTEGQMASYRARNGLDSGITGFKKGAKPWNKGKTGYMGANKTSFKKGHKPALWKPVGSERVTRDGYIEVKVRDAQKQNNYELKHRHIWKKHHGEIPENHVVMFKDGDKLNVELSNLLLVSRGQLAVFNRYYKRSGFPMLDEVTLNKIKLDLMVKDKELEK